MKIRLKFARFLPAKTTVAVLRCAAEVHRLAVRLPHCLGRFTAYGVPARPAAHPPEPAAPADCPLPPAADKRLTPLIVLRCVIMMFLPVLHIEVIVSQSASINPIRVVSAYYSSTRERDISDAARQWHYTSYP